MKTFHPLTRRISLKKSPILLLFSLFCFSLSWGQGFDSLIVSLQRETNIERKLELYDDLVSSLSMSNPQEAIIYGNLMLKLAENHKSSEKVYFAHKRLGFAHVQIGDFNSALVHYQTCFEAFDNTIPDSEKAKILNNLGLIYKELRQFPMALFYLSESLIIKRQIGNQRGIANTYNNIGLCHHAMENFEDALHYYLKAYNLREENGFEADMFSSYLNFAAIYYWLGNPHKSIEYYHSAFSILDTIEQPHSTIELFKGKAETHILLEEYEDAKHLINRALKVNEKLDNTELQLDLLTLKGKVEFEEQHYKTAFDILSPLASVSDSTVRSGNTFLMLGEILEPTDPIQAEKYFFKSLAIGKILNSFLLKKDAFFKLSQHFEYKGDYKLANTYSRKHKQASDSLLNIQKEKHIQGLKIRHETEQKELQIKALEKDKLRQRQKTIYTTILFFIILFLCLIWIIKSKRIRKRLHQIQIQERRIKEQEQQIFEEKIELRNKELTFKSMNISETNERISKSVKRLMAFSNYLDEDQKTEYSRILSDLNQEKSEENWIEFRNYFIKTNRGFFERLNAKFSNLTSSEKRLCAFLSLNLSSKEIASMLHISHKSVEVSRSRLRKKLNLTNTKTSMTSFLSEI